MTCPDLRVLSQLADRELTEAEAEPLTAHVAACAGCSARATRMQRALSAAAAAASSESSTAARASSTAACLSSSELARWLDATTPAPERAAAERHVDACNACLEQALAAARLLARLDAAPTRPVSAALKARVASRWPQAPAAEPELTSLVVRVTRAGASLLESHVLAPLRDLLELPLPAPVMRSTTAVNALKFRLHAPDAVIEATVVPAGEAVGLTLVIADEDGLMLPDLRVFLRRRGRSIYSARTDRSGALRIPSLDCGVYEVTCPGIGTSFRLDLRT